MKNIKLQKTDYKRNEEDKISNIADTCHHLFLHPVENKILVQNEIIEKKKSYRRLLR